MTKLPPAIEARIEDAADEHGKNKSADLVCPTKFYSFIEGAKWMLKDLSTHSGYENCTNHLMLKAIIGHVKEKNKAEAARAMKLVDALEQYIDVPIDKVAGVDNSGPELEEIYEEEFVAREALDEYLNGGGEDV